MVMMIQSLIYFLTLGLKSIVWLVRGFVLFFVFAFKAYDKGYDLVVKGSLRKLAEVKNYKQKHLRPGDETVNDMDDVA